VLTDAFARISEHLASRPDCPDGQATSILDALDLIMKNNCFRFGDTFWLQTDGTATLMINSASGSIILIQSLFSTVGTPSRPNKARTAR